MIKNRRTVLTSTRYLQTMCVNPVHLAVSRTYAVFCRLYIDRFVLRRKSTNASDDLHHCPISRDS